MDLRSSSIHHMPLLFDQIGRILKKESTCGPSPNLLCLQMRSPAESNSPKAHAYAVVFTVKTDPGSAPQEKLPFSGRLPIPYSPPKRYRIFSPERLSIVQKSSKPIFGAPPGLDGQSSRISTGEDYWRRFDR